MTSAVPTAPELRNRRLAAIADFSGTGLEWYDFPRYAPCASEVFPTVLFPDGDKFVGPIVSFGSGDVVRQSRVGSGSCLRSIRVTTSASPPRDFRPSRHEPAHTPSRRNVRERTRVIRRPVGSGRRDQWHA